MQVLPATLIAAVAFGLAVPALAQDQDTIPSPEERRAVLNREQAEFAQRQIEENAASQRAYEDAVRAREIEIQSLQEHHERQRQRHEEAMERWRADVAACNAGDKRRCASQ